MDELSKYFENSKASAERSRSVYYLVVIVCLTYFIAWLNTGPVSWTDAIVESLSQDQQLAEKGEFGTRYLPDHDTRTTSVRSTDASNRVWLLQKAGVLSYKEIVARKDSYAAARVSNRYVQLPLVNLKIIVYDLTLLMAFALASLMSVLYFALANEMRNLRISFGAAHREGKVDFAFKYLSGFQVLRDPRPSRGFGHRFGIPFFLVGLPTLVTVYAWIEDVATLPRITLIDHKLAQPRFLSETAIVAIFLFLATLCMRENHRIGKYWATIEERLGPHVIDADALAFENASSYEGVVAEHDYPDAVETCVPITIGS